MSLRLEEGFEMCLRIFLFTVLVLSSWSVLAAEPESAELARAAELLAEHEQQSADPTAALRGLEQALEIYERHANEDGQVKTLLELIKVYSEVNDGESLKTALDKSLILFEKRQGFLASWMIRFLFGGFARSSGDRETAEDLLRRALADLEQLRQPGSRFSFTIFTAFADQLPVPIETIESMGPLLEIVRPMLVDQFKAATLTQLGGLEIDLERFEQAASTLGEARRLAQGFGFADAQLEHEFARLRERTGMEPSEPLKPMIEESLLWSEQASPYQTPAIEEADRLIASLESFSGPTRLGAMRTQLEKALKLYEEAGDLDGQFMSLLLLGKNVQKLEGVAPALEIFRRARALLEPKDFFAQMMVLGAMAAAERVAERHERALDHAKKALASLKNLRAEKAPIMKARYLQLFPHLSGVFQVSDQGTLMLNVGDSVFSTDRDLPGPLQEWVRASILDLFEAELLSDIGKSLVALERFEEASVYLDEIPEALVFESPNALKIEALIQHRQKNDKVARQLHQDSLRATADLRPGIRLLFPDHARDITVSNSSILADLDELNRRGNRIEDFSHWEQELKEARQEKDPEREIRALLGMGRNPLRLEASTQFYERALELARDLGREDLEAEALEDRVTGLLYRGEFEAAIRSLEQSVAIYRSLGRKSDQARALGQLGYAYSINGSQDLAGYQLREAQRLAREYGDPSLEVEVAQQTRLAIAMLNRRQSGDLFLPDFVSKLNEGDAYGKILSAINISRAVNLPDEDRGKAAEAIILNELERVRGIDFFWVPVIARLNLGLIYLKHDRCAEAQVAFEEVINSAESPMPDQLGAMARLGLGMAMWQQGDTEGAIAVIKELIELLEREYSEIQVDDLLADRVGLRDWYFYETLIKMLVRQGHSKEAFLYSERAKSQVFLRQISGARTVLLESVTEDEDNNLFTEIQATRQRLIDLEKELAETHQLGLLGGESPRLWELARQRDRAREEYEHLLVRLELAHPDQAARLGAESFSLLGLQQEILDDHSVLIAYHMGVRHTLAWIIDREQLQAVEIPVATKILVNKVQSLRDLIASRDPDAEIVATELHRLLIAPLLSHLGERRNLIIVPHKILHSLPFDALFNAETQRFLVEDFTVSQVPSASSLRLIAARERRYTGRSLVMGDPDGTLPHAAREASDVARVVGGKAKIGSEASESEVYARASEIEVLHLAAHATFEREKPLFSRVELAPDEVEDGKLEVHEILRRLDLRRVGLVVLSACRTASGGPTSGDEQVGLTRAFLLAGSPVVITTLWSIDDEASSVLMGSFYAHLSQGSAPAAALRLAQLDVLRQERWRSPYFWAAFALNGDGRGGWKDFIID